MFSLAGLCVLLFFLYLRPQETIPALRTLPILNLAAALSAIGLVIDVRMGRARVSLAPQLPYLIAFMAWGALVTLVKGGPMAALSGFNRILIPCIVFALLAHSVTTFRSLEVVLVFILGFGLSIAGVGVHQSLQPTGCFAVKDKTERDFTTANYDGRQCQTYLDCYESDREPGMEYLCEHPGILGTASVSGGRVRFIGILQDPNDMALAIGIVVPFAFGLLERRRTGPRLLLLIATAGVVGFCIIRTNSRGGQLVFLTVLGAYLVRRVGLAAGALFALFLAVPILLFGGRSGLEADASRLERTDTLWVGLKLILANPLLGVGLSRFVEHHYLTAHNAYVLAWAELGLPGYFLWTAMLYLSVKTLVLAEERYSARPEARVAVAWSKALLASMAGLFVGIFFLSFTYHVVLFVFLGLCGAFHGAVRRHDPGFRVRLTLPEAVLLLLTDISLMVAINIYLRFKV